MMKHYNCIVLLHRAAAAAVPTLLQTKKPELLMVQGVMPGVSMGTRTIDCCRCAGLLRSVLPIKIPILHRSSRAPVDHHLRPLITYLIETPRMSKPALVCS